MGIFGSTMFFIILCVAVGYYASTTGRNFFLWAFVSALITPFLSSIILLILDNRSKV